MNFVTAHDGFTLADLVSYAGKHNEANGEQNRDGTTDNISWNHYVEGPTDDPGVRAARHADIRAMLATLLLSRGVPMLAAGDELGRSQGGNNNAYAQDTTVSWLDWARADHDLAAFTSRLILARRSCPALTDLSHLTGTPRDGSLRPDVVWRRPDGGAMQAGDWSDPEHRTLIADLYRPADEGAPGGSRALVVLHAGWSGFRLTLPDPGRAQAWRQVIDSAAPAAPPTLAGRAMDVAARSVSLFVVEPALAAPAVVAEGGIALSGADVSARLSRLAEAAGLSHDWWDIEGTNHLVPDDSKRALLHAMKLPADTAADLDASLYSLSLTGAFAALPPSLVVAEGSAVNLPLGPALGLLGRAIALTLLRQDGSRDRVVVTPQTGALSIATAPDGRTATIRTVTLPAQPLGRHRILCEDGPEPFTCLLTVTPARCYLPPALSHGERRFGLAAHLYTLRRNGDQGIGDFSTLAEIGWPHGGGGWRRHRPQSAACALPREPRARKPLFAVRPPLPRPDLCRCRGHSLPRRSARGAARHSRPKARRSRRRGRRAPSIIWASGPPSGACLRRGGGGARPAARRSPGRRAPSRRFSPRRGRSRVSERFATFEAISAAYPPERVAGLAGGAAPVRQRAGAGFRGPRGRSRAALQLHAMGRGPSIGGGRCSVRARPGWALGFYRDLAGRHRAHRRRGMVRAGPAHDRRRRRRATGPLLR